METLHRRYAYVRKGVGDMMKRASAAQKLALAFALFLVPLGFVATQLAHYHNEAVERTRLEREGATYLSVVNQARTLMHMQSRAYQFGSQDLNALSTAIRSLRSAKIRYAPTFGDEESTERAIFSMQVMLNNPGVRGTASAAASEALADLAEHIADRSHLMRDPTRTGHFAVDILTQRGPLLAQEARELAMDAQHAASDRRLSETDNALLLQRMALITSRTEALTDAVEAMSAESEAVERALEPASVTLLVNMEAYRSAVEMALSRGRLNAHDLIAIEAGAQSALTELTGRVARQLDAHLAARASVSAREYRTTMLVAAALFMFVLLIVIMIVRVGLIQPIDSLSQSIRAIADGNYDTDIPALNRGDEIGDMARALSVLRGAAQAKISADAARAAAESANRAKSQFVANMSHELRTPLNAIIGYAEILTEDAEDRDDRSSISDLQRINMAARHLLAVINDILDLSKIEAGRMDVLAAPTDPAAIAHEALGTAQPLALKNKNALRANVDAVHDSFVDAQKLRQCLLNLLSNACKFTKGGEVTLEMCVSDHDGSPHLTFAVRDTGIGMTEEELSRLFRPFEQANANVSRNFGGTGLGLMITRRMAQMMGGDVSVTSAPGQGACFTLRIPQFYKGFGTTEDGMPRQGPEHAPLALVIDDEASARDLAVRALTQVGFAVQGARTAEAGLVLARSEAPSLIILDINLPDRDGWSLISELASFTETSAIPIVVLSIEEDRRRSLSLGAAEHLVKPTTRDVLCAAALRLARVRPAPILSASELERLIA